MSGLFPEQGKVFMAMNLPSFPTPKPWWSEITLLCL